MKLLNKVFFLCIMIFALGMSENISAQKTLLDVRIDSAAILIGEQTKLHLTLTTDKDKPVQLLIPTDTLMNGVEVLDISKGDTTLIENNRQVVKKDILITSFDSALYLLPPIMAIDGSDTVLSGQVALKVSTIPVNVDKPEEFYDIKDVWSPPFVLADYYVWIFGILLALFLICVIGYIIQKIRNKESILPTKKAELKLPPYEQAKKELDEIREQKLWQQGRSKEYYTQLTDTLRRYLAERFYINAMEMTSYEIIQIVSKNEDCKPVYQNLQQILNLSDFVKFAKLNPLPDENNMSLQNAYLFIDETKEKPLPVEEEKSEEEENTEKSQNKQIDSKEIKD